MRDLSQMVERLMPRIEEREKNFAFRKTGEMLALSAALLGETASLDRLLKAGVNAKAAVYLDLDMLEYVLCVSEADNLGAVLETFIENEGYPKTGTKSSLPFLVCARLGPAGFARLLEIGANPLSRMGNADRFKLMPDAVKASLHLPLSDNDYLPMSLARLGPRKQAAYWKAAAKSLEAAPDDKAALTRSRRLATVRQEILQRLAYVEKGERTGRDMNSEKTRWILNEEAFIGPPGTSSARVKAADAAAVLGDGNYDWSFACKTDGFDAARHILGLVPVEDRAEAIAAFCEITKNRKDLMPDQIAWRSELQMELALSGTPRLAARPEKPHDPRRTAGI